MVIFLYLILEKRRTKYHFATAIRLFSSFHFIVNCANWEIEFLIFSLLFFPTSPDSKHLEAVPSVLPQLAICKSILEFIGHGFIRSCELSFHFNIYGTEKYILFKSF